MVKENMSLTLLFFLGTVCFWYTFLSLEVQENYMIINH